jgi:hypothetical protein
MFYVFFFFGFTFESDELHPRYLFLSISPIFQITFSPDELGIKNEIKVQRQDDFKE